MKNWKKFSGAGGLAVLLSTTAAFADVSNRDVWDAWKGVLTNVGYEVSGDESEAGGVLTVSDLVMSFDMAPEDGDVRMAMGDLRFEEQGDGTVRIVVAETVPIHVSVTEDGESSSTVFLTTLTTMRGADIVASGDPMDVTYTYSAEGVDFVLDSVVQNGEPLEDMEFKVLANGVAGQSSATVGDAVKFAQQSTITSMSIIAKGDDEEEGVFDLKADILGLAFDASGMVPEGAEEAEPGDLFRAGFNMGGTFSSEGSTIVVSADEGKGPTNINMTSGKSTLLMRAGDGAFEYDGGVNNLALNMLSPDLPLPVVLNMNEFSYGFLMPLLKGDTPQSFDASLKLAGLTVSDMLFEDIVNDDMEDSDEIPGELNSLSLTEIVIDMVGANITGDGAFTFDNTDMQTFDGFPRPTGAVNLQAKGINGLLDTLVAMGLLPEEQVMGARMMMAMFTVPGASEDEMSSTIEINEGGHVLANGQRIQ